MVEAAAEMADRTSNSTGCRHPSKSTHPRRSIMATELARAIMTHTTIWAARSITRSTYRNLRLMRLNSTLPRSSRREMRARSSRKFAFIGIVTRARREISAATYTGLTRKRCQFVPSSSSMASAISKILASSGIPSSGSRTPKSIARTMSEASASLAGLIVRFGTVRRSRYVRIIRSGSVPKGPTVTSST